MSPGLAGGLGGRVGFESRGREGAWALLWVFAGCFLFSPLRKKLPGEEKGVISGCRTTEQMLESSLQAHPHLEAAPVRERPRR